MPTCFFTAGTIVDRGEAEFTAPVSGIDHRCSFPPQPTSPVVPAKSRARCRCGCPVQPFAPVTFRAPLAHPGNVGDEVVYQVGRRADIDAATAAPGCGHAATLLAAQRCRLDQRLLLAQIGTVSDSHNSKHMPKPPEVGFMPDDSAPWRNCR